jgi:ABC-type transporter Mla subunit MlaD
MDGREEEGRDPDPIWGWPADDLAGGEELGERTGGRLRRRSAEPKRQAASNAPLATPTPGSGQGEDAGDLSGALTAMNQRIEALSDATLSLRADLDRFFADIAGALTNGQQRIQREVNDTLVRSLETLSTDLNARFQEDLGNLTAKLAGALDQVAGHLERLKVAYDDNRDAVDDATEALAAMSNRVDELMAEGTTGQDRIMSELKEVRKTQDGLSALSSPDLSALTDAVTRVGDLVEALTRRIG